MGQISITVAGVTSSRTFADGKAAAIIAGFIAAQGGAEGMSNQAKLDWFLNRILEVTQDAHRRRKITDAVETARQNAEGSIDTWE